MDLDVTSSDETLSAKMAEANAVYGKITHVVNCAGYILEGGVEEASGKEVLDHFNTNVLGTFNVARAVIRYLRAAAAVSGGDGQQQQVALANFGSLGSWSSGAGVAHCKFLPLYLFFCDLGILTGPRLTRALKNRLQHQICRERSN